MHLLQPRNFVSILIISLWEVRKPTSCRVDTRNRKSHINEIHVLTESKGIEFRISTALLKMIDKNLPISSQPCIGLLEKTERRSAYPRSISPTPSQPARYIYYLRVAFNKSVCKLRAVLLIITMTRSLPFFISHSLRISKMLFYNRHSPTTPHQEDCHS